MLVVRAAGFGSGLCMAALARCIERGGLTRWCRMDDSGRCIAAARAADDVAMPLV
jgi:hypothetical protein